MTSTTQSPSPAQSILKAAGDRRRRTGEGMFQGLLILASGIGLLFLGLLLITVALKGSGRLSWDFLNSFPSRRATQAGFKAAIFGSLWLLGLTASIAVPLSVGAAIWLEEMAPRNRFAHLIEVNISNLAGVPSVVYGMLAYGVFAQGMRLGLTLWTGALALVMLVFPVIVIAARESIRAVPPSIRQGAYALGATRWQVTRRAVLPPANSGILTGCILALSRAIGEAAPLLLLGALVFIADTPSGPGDRFTAMPIQIYNWVNRPQEDFRVAAAAGIMVLLGVLLSVNATAILIRNRTQVRW